MAKLKTSEVRLLTMFGSVAFILANFFLWNIYKKKKNEVVFEINESSAQIELYRSLLPDRDMWVKRRAWLEARLPLYTSETEEAIKLEGAVQQAANLSGVDIEMKPIAHNVTEDYQQIGLAVKASGGNEAIVRFLSLLQTRDAFRLMPTLDITPDKKDPAIVRAELTLNQLYSLETYVPSEPAVPEESENPEPPAVPAVPEVAASAGPVSEQNQSANR